MNNEAQIAAYKFANMIKNVTTPWSEERPYDVARVKTALEKIRNTMARPRQDAIFNSLNVAGNTSNGAATEEPYKSTPAYPWENEDLDNITFGGSITDG